MQPVASSVKAAAIIIGSSVLFSRIGSYLISLALEALFFFAHSLHRPRKFSLLGGHGLRPLGVPRCIGHRHAVAVGGVKRSAAKAYQQQRDNSVPH
ncbi:hypothetical protein ASF66_01145 [Pseudomonas sp. Leaf129]|nr:hypothetical protein ASF66_01145 [Pseudomonas sp. Leaf129]